jgi:hypothetical protein
MFIFVDIKTQQQPTKYNERERAREKEGILLFALEKKTINGSMNSFVHFLILFELCFF